MNRSGRRSTSCSPAAEACERRLLLSAARVHAESLRSGILLVPGGQSHPERPNTPVLGYGAPASVATFIDPSVKVQSGKTITFGGADYVAPFARLDGIGGAIRVGSKSAILDNALVFPNATGQGGTPFVSIGDNVLIAPGATVSGNSTIGAFNSATAASSATGVGVNAVVSNSIISPGSIVGVGATVSGVTLPSGYRVLPHAVVTTNAEASNPALGRVVKVAATDLSAVTTELSSTVALAGGYTTLYQGQSATGAAGAPEAATSVVGLNNGNLAAVSGSSQEPGGLSFEPSRRGPLFQRNYRHLIANQSYAFPARVVGGVIFHQNATAVAGRVGKHVSIRGDEGQPITIGSIARLGKDVTIRAVQKGSLTIGQHLLVGNGSAIIGGTGSTVGDDVNIGNHAVVDNSRIGSGVVVGDGAYVTGSTVAAGTVIAPGELLINGVRQ